MKKGEIYEGVIEKVDFPNKGIVRSVPDVQREDFWKYWRSLRLKQENRSAAFFRNVEDACIRPCPMKTSSK